MTNRLQLLPNDERGTAVSEGGGVLADKARHPLDEEPRHPPDPCPVGALLGTHVGVLVDFSPPDQSLLFSDPNFEVRWVD